MEILKRFSDALEGMPWLYELIVVAASILLCVLSYLIAKKVLVRIIRKVAARSANKIDDTLVERHLFDRLANLVPALVLYLSGYALPAYQAVIQRLAQAYVVLVSVQVVDALINSAADIYYRLRGEAKRSVSGIVQTIKLLSYILGGIFMVALILDKSPWGIISSIGALTAILMLIFKDTILSLVASFQISFNKTMKLGDWITLPPFGADGEIIDITLNTVKIQNWDKTIVSVPTHKFLDQPFKNWSGMSEAGGRRIKRNLYIDQHSIKICSRQMLERFKKIRLLTAYLAGKEKDIRQYNTAHMITGEQDINGRRLTNIGTFRAYVQRYLEEHPQIHSSGMTLMVRQLQPEPTGLPLQIYCFTKDTRWVNYEGIQADIFDHLLAIVREFELEVFQEPTGADFRKALS